MNKLPLVVAVDHPAFAGHFPGRPIVPGVVLLDLAQGAIEAAAGVRVTGVAVAKFLSPVSPGEALELAFEVVDAGVRFQIQSSKLGGERPVANGRFAIDASGAAS
jgi:3-hydroxymyristoyl/3-hydroxydecanoyl-(acyl carrier protein) dehydratase